MQSFAFVNICTLYMYFIQLWVRKTGFLEYALNIESVTVNMGGVVGIFSFPVPLYCKKCEIKGEICITGFAVGEWQGI